MSRSRRSSLVLVPLVFALAGCGRLFPPPVPEGEPLELSMPQAAVTWTDKWGGTLELEPDGTYTADRACGGDGRESGSGTWDRGRPSGVDEADGNEISVEYESDVTTYEALRNGRTLKLWSYVGDPDNGDLCILTAPAW
ncbi:hypothetical protein ACFQ6U_11385 [Streptomyces sp. NPDC056465]|uniref:hypothetical protein n=1 Tax=Streptomyces sp. NPDC056465 TaxID=3345829 RepID=UPI0036B2948B